MSRKFEPTIKLVHADQRGEMYSIELPDNRELMLLHSVAGSLRGGHSHNVPEQVMVLVGCMVYQKLHDEGLVSRAVLGPGDCSKNDAGQVHMGEFTEDTWLIELKQARKGTWSQENYEPWRVKVRGNATH